MSNQGVGFSDFLLKTSSRVTINNTSLIREKQPHLILHVSMSTSNRSSHAKFQLHYCTITKYQANNQSTQYTKNYQTTVKAPIIWIRNLSWHHDLHIPLGDTMLQVTSPWSQVQCTMAKLQCKNKSIPWHKANKLKTNITYQAPPTPHPKTPNILHGSKMLHIFK